MSDCDSIYLVRFNVRHLTEICFSSQQLAKMIYNSKCKDGFLCSRMEYMFGYRQTYKFTNEIELEKAICSYCEQNDIEEFDFSTFYIIYSVDNKLYKITIEVCKKFQSDMSVPPMQRETASHEEANVYTRLFPKIDKNETTMSSQEVTDIIELIKFAKSKKQHRVVYNFKTTESMKNLEKMGFHIDIYRDFEAINWQNVNWETMQPINNI